MPDGIELAKAYVQIVPSAEGIQGKITEALGGEPAAAGDAAGQSLGAQLVGTLKKVIAAAGIGKIISDSINMGGALQQSLGGVETLFKDSADTVKEYAAQAYRTAGLSANDYMEQTTSFAASLLSSVSQDTNAAAQLANMAMVDMADNSNKMGTSMVKLAKMVHKLMMPPWGSTPGAASASLTPSVRPSLKPGTRCGAARWQVILWAAR